ncbi:hypothetical protein [Streptomyces parvulus]|uniref:hypothetical protein n=1 Tax=Streptomyces parvulus TaxID=146923 RepID=UPI0033C6AC03
MSEPAPPLDGGPDAGPGRPPRPRLGRPRAKDLLARASRTADEQRRPLPDILATMAEITAHHTPTDSPASSTHRLHGRRTLPDHPRPHPHPAPPQ